MNIRLYNARILTMEKDKPIFRGEIWIKEEQIVYIAKDDEVEIVCGPDFPNLKWDREIDCEGNLLMPGFKDAHTHSAMTLMRSLADDLPLQEWLETKIFPTEAKLTGEDIYDLTKLAVLEYLTSGITGIFDMYLTPDTVAKACEEMGMRCVLVSGLNNFTSSIEQTEKEFLKWNEQDSLISYKLGCHAEYTCEMELLKKLADLAHKYQAPIFAHMSETKKEVEDCIEKYGMSPVALFESLGLFDFGGGIYHGVYLSDEDKKILKKRDVFIITNPASNAKLASGIAPIKTYLEEGITIAIGTDGPSSNNCLDMFREMFLVAALNNLLEKDASAVSAKDILQISTVNSAHAMGLVDADILAQGKLADIIMIDLQQPNMQPIHNIVNNLVFSGSKINVKMTIINGKILYENQKFFVGMEPEEIYEKCKHIAERVIC